MTPLHLIQVLSFSSVFSFSCIFIFVYLHSPFLTAPFPSLENNVLRFHTKGIRLREQHYNCTISVHKHIKHRCHHTENSVCEVCYGPCTFKAQRSICCTCDRHGFYKMRPFNLLLELLLYVACLLNANAIG